MGKSTMSVRNAEPDGSELFRFIQVAEHGTSVARPAVIKASVSDATLYKLSAIAGFGSGLVLLVNAAKRSGMIASTDLTQLLAPLAEIMALGLVVGLFLAFGRRAGLFGLIAFVAHFIALSSLEGVEVLINLVFTKLPIETITELRAGPLGLVLTVTSLLFLFSAVAFVIALIMGKAVPSGALALYVAGVVPIALRTFVPEWALDLGLVSLAAAIFWLSGALWNHAQNERGTNRPT
jgi:hypothetical protein